MGGSSCKEEKAETSTKVAEGTSSEYDAMSAKQLKGMLTERGIEYLRCVEKSDLIKCLEVSDQKRASKTKSVDGDSKDAKKAKKRSHPSPAQRVAQSLPEAGAVTGPQGRERCMEGCQIPCRTYPDG